MLACYLAFWIAGVALMAVGLPMVALVCVIIGVVLVTRYELQKLAKAMRPVPSRKPASRRR